MSRDKRMLCMDGQMFRDLLASSTRGDRNLIMGQKGTSTDVLKIENYYDALYKEASNHLNQTYDELIREEVVTYKGLFAEEYTEVNRIIKEEANNFYL